MKIRSSTIVAKAMPVAFALLVMAGTALAQDADTPAAEGKSLWDHFKIGGPFMYPLLMLSAGVVGLSVYNIIQLGRKRWVPAELKDVLYDHMANCRVRSAIELANTSPSYLGRMLAVALPKVDATNPENLGRDAVEDTMAEFVSNETREPVTWINYLTTIMQAAPMLGLLGTVSGMVGAFAKLSDTGGADPSKLAENISEALYTTMFGLIIAVPALIAYAIFRNLFNRRIAEITDSGKELLEVCIHAVHGEHAFAKVPEGLHAE